MHTLPGVAPVIAKLNQAKFQVSVFRNQCCVAIGLISVSELDSVHQRKCDALAHFGASADVVYYRPNDEQSPCSRRIRHQACRWMRPKLIKSTSPRLG